MCSNHDINTLRKKIWEKLKERIKDAVPPYRSLTLYSPVVQLNSKEEFRIDDAESLLKRAPSMAC